MNICRFERGSVFIISDTYGHMTSLCIYNVEMYI